MELSTDVLQGMWHELKGKVKGQWGKLTDDDIARLTGRMEELAGVLQQRYGYSKAQAEAEINNWLGEIKREPKAPAEGAPVAPAGTPRP